MNVAQHVIDKCRGPGNVRRLLKVSRSRPYGWMEGGYIPARWQMPLLKTARAEGIDLRPEDFMGADFRLPPLGANDNTPSSSNDNVASPRATRQCKAKRRAP
jgi:hypothetical protein